MNCLISATGVGQLCNKLKLLQGPSYPGYTKSISWLLMSWILASPGHHRSWYWMCKLVMFLSYMREDFHTIVVFVWSNYIDCRYISCFLCCGMYLKGVHRSILPDTITISIYVISTEMCTYHIGLVNIFIGNEWSRHVFLKWMCNVWCTVYCLPSRQRCLYKDPQGADKRF